MNSKPPPNPNDCKPVVRDGAKYLLRDQMLKTIEALGFEHMQTCLTCINFSEHAKRMSPNYVQPEEFCNRFNGRPPARIIAYGCPSYTHNDEIPF